MISARIYIFLLLVFVTIIGKPLYAQDAYIDSLETLIKNSGNQNQELILKKISHLRFINADLALKECLKLKQGSKNKTIKAELAAEIDFQLGMIYFTKGDYVKCVGTGNYLLKKNNTSYGKAIGYYLIAIVNDQQKKRSVAKEEYQKSLDLLADTGYLAFRAELYNSIGNNFYYTKGYDQAIYYFNEAIKINKTLKSNINLGFNLNNLANVYLSLFKYKEAEANYNELLSIAAEDNNELGISIAYLNLGLLYSRQKLYNKAEELLEKGLNAAQKVKVKDIIRVYYTELSTVNRSRGKFEKALDYYILATAYSDSLSKENTLKALAETEGKLKKKEDSLTIQKLENTTLEQKAKEDRIQQESSRKTLFLISAGIVLVLMLALVLLVVANNNKRKKLNLALQNEKIKVEHKNTEILDSINYARHLQNGILPPLKLFTENFSDSFVLYLPKDIVAGDFYWLEKTNTTLYFAAADCTGHGVPGAMVSVVCSNALHRAVVEFSIHNPADILNKVRDLVIETFSKSESQINDGMDISLCALNTETNQLVWAGANNPLWIIQATTGKLIELKGDKQPVGNSYNTKPFTAHNFQLETNDSVYLFTDGFADQFGGANGKKFKYKTLANILQNTKALSKTQQKEKLKQELDAWKGKLDQIDDICIIGIQV